MQSRISFNPELEPSDVVHFFATSPDSGMRALAPDLAKAFGLDNAPITTQANLSPDILLNLNKIVDAQGRFLRGSNATIAEILFGSRTATGGSKNKQIQDVKTRVQAMFATTTSTSQKAA